MDIITFIGYTNIGYQTFIGYTNIGYQNFYWIYKQWIPKLLLVQTLDIKAFIRYTNFLISGLFLNIVIGCTNTEL